MQTCVTVRTQAKDLDINGRTVWKRNETNVVIDPTKTALLLCDVWDNHWCRGAAERLDEMVPRMSEMVEEARAAGILIIHAPSGTMDRYADCIARKRMRDIPVAEPKQHEHDDPPLPIDASDQGSDTGEAETHRAWSSQHPGIRIDEKRDVISDDGKEIYSLLSTRGIGTMLIFGVHTNMCVLHRTFGIKQMVKWGIDTILIRDLTDTMYNPAMRPYVSHETGTDLVIGYIEKFWCPTVSSSDLLG
ncbi:MAG: isochorismatase family protein [Candidatus Latescibacterota bacterium]|nr:isochorismatase family protein [Candidatus Latescibacterota bacterium]